MKKLILTFSIIALILSCANSKRSSKKNLTVMQKAFLTDNYSEFARESAETQIINASILDSTLTLNVSYSGGCKDHEFKLIGSNLIQKSMPPIRSIMLIHNANSDDCRELIEQELKFNISDFKYLGGDIMLNLKGYSSKILYKTDL